MVIIKIIITLLLLSYYSICFANEKVTLYLDWIDQFQFAGYYVAKEKGFYQNLNLDVEIKEYTKNKKIIEKVMGNPSSYGIGKSSLILDKFHGNDIVLLSSIFQNSPLVLLSLKSSNIKNIQDIKDKKIMITNDAVEAASIKSMIKSQNIDLKDISIQSHTFDIEDLIQGNTDVMAGYLSNEPYILEKRKIPYNIINPNDYDFKFYEGILFTSKEEFINNPIRVQNFNEASLKGWEYAFKNINETAKLIFEKYNSQNKTLEELIYEGEILKKLAKFDDGLLGDIDSNKIENLKNFYNFLGLNTKNNKFDTNSIILKNTEIILDKNLQQYLKDNRFTLLVEDENIPFSFKSADEFKGLEIDFWDLISKKLKKPFNIEETINNKIFNIFSDTIKVKFIYNYDGKAKDNYILSNSLAQIPMGIVTKNTKIFINDLSALSNIKIGVLGDSKIFSKLQKEYPSINFEKVTSIKEGLYNVESGIFFGLIDDIYSLSHNINKNKLVDLKINSTIKYSQNMYLQVNKENKEFIDLINTVINRFSKDEKRVILNNYQQILYHQDLNYIQIAKIIVPLILLLILFIFFNIRLKKEIMKRKDIETELLKLANKDSLTNIFNRRKIEEICENEIKRSERYQTNFSLIFFDLNDFKPINDKLGHHIGDKVLIAVAQTVSTHIRQTDSFGRWGGDEFLIILPQTNITQAKKITSLLEENLDKIVLDFDKSLKISCSFGISEYEENDTSDSLIKRADEEMYMVKTLYKKNKNQSSKD